MKQELLKGLTEEQIAKVKACKNQEEVLKIAKEEGIELTDEQLEAVSGGGAICATVCPNCGYSNINHIEWLDQQTHVYWRKKKCRYCDYEFDIHQA